MVQCDTVTCRGLQSLIHQEVNEAVYCSNLTECSEDNNEERRRDKGEEDEEERRRGEGKEKEGKDVEEEEEKEKKEEARIFSSMMDPLALSRLFILSLSRPQSVSL